MADEIKKVPDEVKENTANTLEGEIADDEVEAVAGGTDDWDPTCHSGSAPEPYTRVSYSGNTGRHY